MRGSSPTKNGKNVLNLLMAMPVGLTGMDHAK